MIIHARTPARAGLIGNPSDGYHGVTIAFTFDAFWADVWLWESPELEIRQAKRDATGFASVDDLVESVQQYGYYGGIRLIKAITKVFADYCRRIGITLDRKNFTISYQSNIPIRVGLAGSSAIIRSTLKALMCYYGVDIPPEIRPNLILKAETQELDIGAGLQDRVAQTYGGVIYMDFDKKIMDERGFGRYESLDPKRMPPLFLAYHDSAASGTEVPHNDLRARYERGVKQVRRNLKEIADGARKFRALLDSPEHDLDHMEELINHNFDLRAEIVEIDPFNRRLIDTARSVGASAKYCGSGGAVLGICRDNRMFKRLQQAYGKFGATVLRPKITPAEEVARSQ